MEGIFQPQLTSTQVPTLTALNIGDIFSRNSILTIIGTKKKQWEKKATGWAALREREAPLDKLGMELAGQQSRPLHRRDCT